MIYAFLSVLLLFVLVTVLAVRDQYLVVLRWPVKWFFLQRGSDGQYHIFPAVRLSLVGFGYAVLGAQAALQAANRRMRAAVANIGFAGHYR